MRICLLCFCCSLFPALSFAGEIPSFEKEVFPILREYCVKCHGPEKQKGKVRLDTLSRNVKEDRSAAETWHDALNVIQLGEMPPDDEPQPAEAERKALTGWIEGKLDSALESMSSKSAGTVLRRLNRDEYAYTMEDLLGFKMNYAEGLLPEPLSKDGFLNNGAALGMSSMQLEAYLKNAGRALQFVLVAGERPKPSNMEVREYLTSVRQAEQDVERAARWLDLPSSDLYP